MDGERVADAARRGAERELRQAAVIRPLGLALLVVFLASVAQAHPRPSLQGRGLVVSVALVGFTAATLWILLASRSVDSRRGIAQSVAVLGVAGACLVAVAWVQRNAPAELALALIVYAAGARLPLRIGAAVAVSVTLAVDLTILADAHAATNVIATTLLATLLFLVAVLVRQSRAEQHRAELLSAQLADSLELREHAARVEERGRIARDLHDVLAHSLSGLAIQLEGARVLARRQPANTELTAALERAATLTRAGTDEARQAVAALRGDAVPGAERIRQLVADFSSVTGIPAELTIEGSPTVLPAEAAGALYRACQEALTNVARHSGSQRARLRLSYRADTATLTVTDHRDGLEQCRALLPDVGSGYGLNAMRERITLLGGTLTAGPTGDGWKVEITIPR